MSQKSIEQVLEEHAGRWMSIPGIVGTGIGECDGEPCIRVFVVRKAPELAKKIPSSVEGFVVDVQVSGQFRALDAENQTS